MVKCFPLALDEVVQRWLWALPSGSISTWEQIHAAFCNNFKGTYVKPMMAGSLFAVKQGPEVLLRDYFRRFIAAKSLIRGLSDSTIIDAAKQGQVDGTEFFSRQHRKPVNYVEKLMNKFEEYARSEEENIRRRVARGFPSLPPRPTEAQGAPTSSAPTTQSASAPHPSAEVIPATPGATEPGLAPQAGRERCTRKPKGRREINVVKMAVAD